MLFPRNYEFAKREQTIDRIVHLREYLHYHISGALMYMHTRMRIQTGELLEKLEHAKMTAKKSVRYTCDALF